MIVLAGIYLKREKYEAALAVLQPVDRESPHAGEIAALKGVLLTFLDRIPDAVSEYAKAGGLEQEVALNVLRACQAFR